MNWSTEAPNRINGKHSGSVCVHVCGWVRERECVSVRGRERERVCGDCFFLFVCFCVSIWEIVSLLLFAFSLYHLVD